eukprot:scaffold4524_cov35-Prasinocladus_malaysianus.AAC.1
MREHREEDINHIKGDHAITLFKRYTNGNTGTHSNQAAPFHQNVLRSKHALLLATPKLFCFIEQEHRTRSICIDALGIADALHEGLAMVYKPELAELLGL